MKTDKELLQLAAKAVGIKCDEVGPFVMRKEWEQFFGCAGEFREVKHEWNPLDDDGQALRLAVDLGLCVDISNGFDCTTIDYFANNDASLCEQHGSDKHAATRRAIVRAAAAIGEQMK